MLFMDQTKKQIDQILCLAMVADSDMNTKEKKKEAQTSIEKIRETSAHRNMSKK